MVEESYVWCHSSVRSVWNALGGVRWNAVPPENGQPFAVP